MIHKGQPMDDQLITLTSLAILKVDLDEGQRDYLDYLQSLIVHVLSTHRPDPVTEDMTSELLLQDFGLKIPLRGCQLVLRRMARKGLLKRQESVYVITGDLPSIDFSEKRIRAHGQISMVYSRLILFVNDTYDFNWSEADASRSLLAFLSKFGVDFLRAYIFNTALPNVPLSAPREQYVVGKFVKALYEANDPVFDNVIVLVKGHMYSNALVCPDLESIEKNFNRVTFYIDTTLMLNYLGLQGNEEYLIADELFSLIRHLQGKIAVFDHTIDEIRRVIIGAEQYLDSPAAEGKLVHEMRRSGQKRSDLILLRENLQDRLKEKQIHIHPTPPYHQLHQVSEVELEEAISSRVHYRNPEAIKHDISSVRSIYVLREGVIPKRLEDAIAVFITTNSGFAKAAFEVGQNHNSTKEVSSVITDYSIANVAWLKAPLGAPELPTKELMAACYAAMEPSASLWYKYLREIDSLKQSGVLTPDDHALLRVSPVVKEELMDLTLGSEEALSGGSIRTLLDRVKTDLVKGKESVLLKERKERLILATERDDLRRRGEKVESNVFWIAERASMLLCRILWGISIPILFCVAFASTFVTTPFVADSRLLTSILNTMLLISASFGFLKLAFDMSIPKLFKDLEKKLQAIIYQFLSKKLLRDD